MSSNAVQVTETLPTGFFDTHLGVADTAVADAVAAELDRQQHQIELIASENIVSRAVLEAQGSVFTNKYALIQYTDGEVTKKWCILAPCRNLRGSDVCCTSKRLTGVGHEGLRKVREV